MADRILAWLGAGILTAGMSVATIAGAGLAIADDGASAGNGGDTASASANPSDAKPNADVADSDNEPTPDVGDPDPDPVESDDEQTDDELGTGGGQSVGDDDEKAGERDDEGKGAEARRDNRRSTRDKQAAANDERTDDVKTAPPSESADAIDAVDAHVEDTVGVEAADPPVVNVPVQGDDTIAVTQTPASEAPPATEPERFRRRRVRHLRRVILRHQPAESVRVHHDTGGARSTAADVDAHGSGAAGVRERLRVAVIGRTAGGPAVDEPDPGPGRAELRPTETPVQAAPAAPTLINVIGTLAFNLLDTFVKVFAGPPSVPANYNVRVARSTLEIDCGDGYTTEADWYVPTSQAPPQGLIYLQHGFLTQPGFYNATAASLAESTNSIVVVPSITSNFFACDSCHLTGDPMHFAVAKLFSGDRAALNASFAAAFPDEDITLPQKYVLVGHSGGSSMAAAVAGFASQLGGPNGSPDLAGVILFDTNDIGEFVSRGIAKVPLRTPVYYVGAEPHIINNFDEVSGVMKELRPNEFTGVHLVGGVHIDILESTNPIPQFIAGLALGAPRPENAAAAKLLASGWINDMFSTGTDTGIYPAPGAALDVETESGTAHVVALGGPTYQPSFFESLISLFYGQINNLRFGVCAADVDALLAAELAGSSSGVSSACRSRGENLEQPDAAVGGCGCLATGLSVTAAARVLRPPCKPEIYAKLPHQTPRYLLTEGLRQANLLGSMYVRFEDASQRPVTFACGG